MTHTFLKALLAQHTAWSAEHRAIATDGEGHTSERYDASHEAAAKLLNDFADAVAVLDARPGMVVDELADALHSEWPGLLNDGLQHSVARTAMRLLLGIELPIGDEAAKDKYNVMLMPACPLCRSEQPDTRKMTGCGLPCDDAARWHERHMPRG